MGKDVKKFLTGVALVASIVGGSTSNAQSSGDLGNSGYSVSKNIGGEYGESYYLIKNNGKWEASRTGDLLKDNVEKVLVDSSSKVIELQVKPQNREDSGDWRCFRGVFGMSRDSNGYTICTSTLTKSIYLNKHAMERALGVGVSLMIGSAPTYVDVDQEAILEIAQSSGLIAMAEQDREAKLAAAAKRQQEADTARQKAEQERLALDLQAEQGDANAKYQRGLFYLGYAGFNVDAEKWFEKAAAVGSADALFKLGFFQKDHYRNETEAERLWKKGAQGGSVAAQTALNDLISERNRKAEQLARARQQQLQHLAQVKEVGQAVCTSFSGTEARAIGSAMGQTVYGRAESRTFKMRGYTEGANGNKIQIRIGGIQKFDAFGNNLGNTDHVDGQTVYQTGSIIWEDAAAWEPC